MNKPVNIYSVVVFDLHPRIKAYIEQLNNDGQIDLDENGYPYVISIDASGGNKICRIVRNGREENFIINTRKRVKEPVVSWNPDDGYRRIFGKRVVPVAQDPKNGPRPERQKRSSFESIQRIIGQMLND